MLWVLKRTVSFGSFEYPKHMFTMNNFMLKLFANLDTLENLQNPSANDVHLSNNNLLILTALAVKCLYTGFNFQSLVVISFYRPVSWQVCFRIQELTR